MRAGDDWGRDPSVRSTREVFAQMEKGQRKLLGALGISPFDPRLRRWREQARAVFDRSWAEAVRSGSGREPHDAGRVYVQGFARILAAAGVDVSAWERSS